jgi:putative flippase GtrA
MRILKNETFSYLFFGILTTIVNYSIFIVGLSLIGKEDVLIVNVFAFVGATLFAYITNKIFVFRSHKWCVKHVLLELGKFSGARLFSLLLEQLGLYVASEWLELGNYFLFSINCLIIAKIMLSFASVLLNYFASKFVVFKKEKINEGTDDCSCL